jgi:hypothetical protein
MSYGLKARRGNEPQGEQEILDLARPDPTSRKFFLVNNDNTKFKNHKKCTSIDLP